MCTVATSLFEDKTHRCGISDVNLSSFILEIHLRFDNHDFTDTLTGLKDSTRAPLTLAVDIRSEEKHLPKTI